MFACSVLIFTIFTKVVLAKGDTYFSLKINLLFTSYVPDYKPGTKKYLKL